MSSYSSFLETIEEQEKALKEASNIVCRMVDNEYASHILITAIRRAEEDLYNRKVNIQMDVLISLHKEEIEDFIEKEAFWD